MWKTLAEEEGACLLELDGYIAKTAILALEYPSGIEHGQIPYLTNMCKSCEMDIL